MTSPANNRGALNAYVNHSLNGICAAGTYILDRGGTVVAPTVLGYMGGWLTGVGSRIGMFQGFASGVYHFAVHRPASTYVANNKGTGPNDLTQNTANFLALVGVIAGIAVPILITYRYGAPVMDFVTSKLGEGSYLKWLIGSVGTREYSLFAGIVVNIAPTCVQHWISWWREEDKLSKRN